ncbi:MAG: hypothetical protein RL071_1549 [Pseudomonadota bacterium]
MRRVPAPPPLVLAGAAAALTLLGARPAAANDPLLLIPAPPVAPAASEPVTVQVWSPAIAADSEITVQGAELLGVEVLADDLAALRLSLPPAAARGEVAVVVRVRGPAGKSDGTIRLISAPAEAAVMAVVADPPRFRVGVDDAATVRLTLPAGLRDPATRRIKVIANVGVVEGVVVDGGAAVARWRPGPDVKSSQIVVLTAIDEAAPDAVVGALAYPVIVRKDLPFPAPAGASVVLTVGERSFGPATAGADGRAVLPVERDPTITKGRLRVVAPGGAVSESDVELAFGEGPRFALLPLPKAVGHDPKAPQPVLAYASGPDGRPWTGAAPQIAADKGKVGAVTAGPGPGFFVAPWDTAGASGAATLTVSLDGRTHTQSTQVVAAANRAPSTLTAEPAALLASGVDTTLGLSAGSALALFGAAPKGGKGKDPSAVAVSLAAGSEALAAVAAPRLPVSGQPVARLVVWTPADVAPADGVSRVPVGVVALDADGLPVPNVPLKWSVEGAGALAGLPTTTGDGLAVGLYVAGSQVGPVGLKVEGAGSVGLSPLFLQGAGFAPAAGASGTAAGLAERALWRSIAPLVVVGRPAGAPLPAVAPMTAADLARMEAEKKAAEKAAKKGAKAPAGGGVAPAGPAGGGGGGGDPLALFGAAPADGMGTSTVRVSLGLLAHPRTYALSAKDAPLPGELEWETPGLLSAPGVDLRAEVHKGAWGGELRLRGSTQAVANPFEEDAQRLNTGELVLAPTYRGAIAPGLCWQAGLGYHRATVPAWAYNDAEQPTALDDEALGANALRLSGGLTIDRERALLGVEVAPSVGAGLTNLAVNAVLGVHIGETWAAQLGWGQDWRRASPEIEGAEASIKEQITGLTLGVAYRLP